MAENIETNVNTNENDLVAENASISSEQLREANERADRNKRELDKALKEAGELKKALKAKQTEEEQKAEADAEAQRLKDEELETLRAENNRHKALSAYKSIDEKTVDKLIEAVASADHSTIAKIIDAEIANAVKKAESQWLANRPRVNAGVGDGNAVTKQSIMAIADRAERQKAIAENLELFQ